MIWIQTSNGGKRSCKYYSGCGNTDNCKNCVGYEKLKVKRKPKNR